MVIEDLIGRRIEGEVEVVGGECPRRHGGGGVRLALIRSRNGVSGTDRHRIGSGFVTAGRQNEQRRLRHVSRRRCRDREEVVGTVGTIRGVEDQVKLVGPARRRHLILLRRIDEAAAGQIGPRCRQAHGEGHARQRLARFRIVDDTIGRDDGFRRVRGPRHIRVIAFERRRPEAGQLRLVQDDGTAFQIRLKGRLEDQRQDFIRADIQAIDAERASVDATDSDGNNDRPERIWLEPRRRVQAFELIGQREIFDPNRRRVVDVDGVAQPVAGVRGRSGQLGAPREPGDDLL